MAQAKRNTTPKFPDVRVRLVGRNGNAFAIVGRVVEEMRGAGIGQSDIAAYVSEATAGTYDEMLRTTMRWVRAS